MDTKKMHIHRNECFKRQKHLISLIHKSCEKNDIHGILTYSNDLKDEDIREKVLRLLI